MDTRLLIIEDDRRVRDMLHRSFAADGFVVDTAVDGEAGLQRIRTSEPDVVILDVAMPGMDGFDVCRIARREQRTMPILLLTARAAVDDRVQGLEIGADDYLPKPFSYSELLARVRALLRRAQPERVESLRFADLVLDPEERSCRRGERQIELTRREFDLLEKLVINARTTMSRWQLIDDVWDGAIDLDSNTLEVYVGYLRKKLEAGGEPRLVHTVRGVGYVVREA